MHNGHDWRSSFLQLWGPGLLAGIRWSDWQRLLREEGTKVDPGCFPRVITVTSQSIKTSLVERVEVRRFQQAWEEVDLYPPIFVLGHWRSGTTYLHELLTQDPQFGFPTSYQVSFPHTFLTTEKSDTRWLSFFVPRCRPMDNMELNLASPQEDEFALAVVTLKSPCLAWVFPSVKERFEKYLTFGEVAAAEVQEWKRALLQFLQKVQFRCDRPLVLKSPPHTARVRLLLEMFPEARFVHIHRDPLRVFQSTRRTLQIIVRWHGLQRCDASEWDDYILRQYVRMYEAFFGDRELIPAGQYHEMGFEELEADPVGELRKAYRGLGLTGFEAAEPRVRAYLDARRGYRKSDFDRLPEGLAGRVAQRWSRCFEEWSYQVSRT